jgi:hypothetical protein
MYINDVHYMQRHGAHHRMCFMYTLAFEIYHFAGGYPLVLMRIPRCSQQSLGYTMVYASLMNATPAEVTAVN